MAAKYVFLTSTVPIRCNTTAAKIDGPISSVRTIKLWSCSLLTLEAPIPQNGQTHSNNSSAVILKLKPR